jgi:hypothetical protein
MYIKDGILFAKGPDLSYILDISLAQKLLEQRLNVSAGKSYPALLDYSNLQYVTKEARQFLSGKQGEQGIVAAAIITPNILARVLLNSFVALYKVSIPVKLFENETSALKWLKQFVQE